MKKTLLFFAILFTTAFGYTAQAVESHTVACTAGNLATVAASYLTTVTNLTVTGTIDARDFKTMRDDMPLLEVIDLSGSTVSAYTGTAGTAGTTSIVYIANGIPDFAFCDRLTLKGKIKLKSFIYPSTVTNIGDSAFYICSGLTGSFTIPASVTIIGNYAFCSCKGFTGSLTISASVTTIGIGAFVGCSGFTGSLTIPASVTTIGDAAFVDCTGFTGSLTIPSSITTINSDVFRGCSGFNGTLTISSSIMTIGTRAFGDCSGLTSILALSTTPIDFNASSVFIRVNKTTCILHVPVGSKGLYTAANQWKDFVNIVDDIVPAPQATNATNILTTSFIAKWNSVPIATKYFLDVATDNAFTNMVAGYNNLDVSNVLSKSITGLAATTTYYYRVRTFCALGTSGNSNVIAAATKLTQLITFNALALST